MAYVILEILVWLHEGCSQSTLLRRSISKFCTLSSPANKDLGQDSTI